MTNYSEKQIYEKLFQIFVKYKKRYKNPPRSTQMACMWSIQNPPDIIEDTPPFHEIENAFNIKIDEDDCLELYDMDLSEAVDKIAKMITQVQKRSVFSAPALKRWDELSPSIQAKLLGNVWCGACGKAVHILIESGRIERNNLILIGQCTDCGGRVTRLVEGE
jgi:hypothetical protein